MLDMPGNMGEPVDPNHYSNWSMLIYRTSRGVSTEAIRGLLGAMKRQYGQAAQVHVEFASDAQRRMTLRFYYGGVRNREDMYAYKQFVATLVKQLPMMCTLIYPV